MTVEDLAKLIKDVYLNLETESITLEISADGDVHFSFDTSLKS